MSYFVTAIAPSAVRRRAPVAAGACLVSFAAFWMAQRAAHVSMVDLMMYRAEGATVRAGGDLYALRATTARLPATYPPFAALLFTPLTLLDTATMRTLATAGNLALLVVFVRQSLRLVGHARVESVWWVAAVAVWCEPVWTTLRYGQINLLLAVLVLWDLSRRPENRWAGIGIGLAAAVKLTPALFAVVLLLAGVVARRRTAAAPPGCGTRVWQPPRSPGRPWWPRLYCRTTPGVSGPASCSRPGAWGAPRTPRIRPCAAFSRGSCTLRSPGPPGCSRRPWWARQGSAWRSRRSCAESGPGR